MNDGIRKIFDIIFTAIVVVFLIGVGVNVAAIILSAILILGIPALIYLGIFCLLNDGKDCRDNRRFTRDEPVIWSDYDYDS